MKTSGEAWDSNISVKKEICGFNGVCEAEYDTLASVATPLAVLLPLQTKGKSL